MVLRRHGAAVDPEPGRLGLSIRGADQARLAEPGAAGKEDGVATTADRVSAIS